LYKIAILVTGTVGQALATRLTGLDYEVMLGRRNVAETSARNTKDNYGGPSFAEWYAGDQQVRLGTFAEAAAFGEILLSQFGWKAQNIIDLGNITAARGTERLILLCALCSTFVFFVVNFLYQPLWAVRLFTKKVNCSKAEISVFFLDTVIGIRG
jgi:hypothetical protein